MNKAHRLSFDFRLAATIVGLLVCAFGLTAALRAPPWASTVATPKRFLGLDTPAESMPRGR